MKDILRQLQQAVKANGGYIFGSFTFADVAMAVRPSTLIKGTYVSYAQPAHDYLMGTTKSSCIIHELPLG